MTENSEQLDVQAACDGSGTLFERRYWVDLRSSRVSPRELMSHIRTNFNDFSPDVLAKFDKVEGSEKELAVDDEFHIRILGPWNGDVRVTKVDEHSFEFITLEGHPEAGTIRFQALERAGEEGGLHFEIRSLARARDDLIGFMHEKLGVGMWIQEKTWLTFCQRVAQFTQGEIVGEVQSATVEREEESWWQRA